VIEAQGEIVGGIGVSGAPPGKSECDCVDGACAQPTLMRFAKPWNLRNRRNEKFRDQQQLNKKGTSPMKSTFFSAALLFGILPINPVLGAALADEVIFSSIMEIRLHEDARLATSQGQHLMIMFTKDGCSPCLEMKKHVLTDPRVQAYFRRHFLSYTVNIFGDLPIVDRSGEWLTEKTYAKRENIWGTPTFYFFGPDGQIIQKHTGALSANEFLSLGKSIVVRQSQHAVLAR
jgi:thioredoxin-related protein